MTGSGNWPPGFGMRQPPQGVGSSSAKLQPNGWLWIFRVRAAKRVGGGPTRDGQSDHATRRGRKLARLEAVLLVADGALSFRKLAQFATLADVTEARNLVLELNEKLDRGGSAFRAEKVATGVRMMTRPQFSMWLDRLHNRQAKARLSPPMLETLAIVSYRQPVTRADVEKIRGVQASEMLRQLMERGLIRITGEDDSLGRPFLYGTTRQFLEEYGLGSLEELPMAETLRRRDQSAEVEEAEEDVAQLFAEEEAGEELMEESTDSEDEDLDEDSEEDEDSDEDDEYDSEDDDTEEAA
jgi:segregation and condensation protein B